MSELIKRLPEYLTLIAKCIESSETPAQLLVCMDFINLFCERFRPLLAIQDYTAHTHELFMQYNKKYESIMPCNEVQPETINV